MTSARAAWTLAIVDIVVFLVTVALVKVDIAQVLFGVGYLIAIASFVGIGAMLVARVPQNPIGPLFLAAGTLVVVGIALQTYSSLGAERTPLLPGTSVALILNEVIAGYPIFIALLGVALPVAVGIAILRYRLFEIDRIVSRTIAYAGVTGLLLATFGGVNLLLQSVVAPASSDSAIAVAASTLLVAALFQPVMRRVRRSVDRRFDRARYDAERTSAAFSERLRDEVDLGAVTADLTGTARATLAPTALGVWIRRGSA